MGPAKRALSTAAHAELPHDCLVPTPPCTEESMDPCIFPNLGANRADAPRRETYTTSIVLPKISDAGVGLYPDALYQFAFALLLKVYVRSNDTAYGLVRHAGSPRHDGAGLVDTFVVSAGLDDAATLLDNCQQLSRQPLKETSGELANGFDHDAGTAQDFRQFNTALCLAPDTAILELEHHLLASDLTLSLETPDSSSALDAEVKATLSFKTILCDRWSASNVVSTFESILAKIAASPESPLRDVDFMSARDKDQIKAWNDAVPPLAHQTLNEVFARVFQENADKQAVYTTEGCFTYGQLDDLSTVLALRLLKLGLKPNTVVPICMNKSRWVTCAMTAVWKAGGALTAMEPSHPDDRLTWIVKEVGATLVICDDAHAHRFQRLGVHIISDLEFLVGACNIDGSFDRAAAWNMGGVAPTDLAFIVFTSGSTGKPKGILNSHSRLTSEPEYLSHSASFGYTKDARVLQFASYAYIPGTGENYRTLLHGATLCVPSEIERTSDLVGFIRRSGSTRSYMTPSLLRTLIPEEIPDLRDVIVGGEPVDSELERLWSRDRHVVQLYGSTEGGSWIKETTHSVPKSKGLLPVGGVQWLVDPHDVNKLVPVGAEGEVMLESHEMSTGYLNDATKTAHAFVESPAWANKRNVAAGCRYLRLGDLARYESDGSITVLGRADTQVKIHGHRVELRDIESNIRALLPEGSEAIVELVKPHDAPERPLLTAFCRLHTPRKDKEVVQTGPGPDSIFPSLQHGLHKALPSHMVPKVYLMLEQLPQNSSGKTDRRKLRTDASEVGYVNLLKHPRNVVAEASERWGNEKERILAQLWSTVLRQDVEDINRQDNFLALGGDSLAAIRLVPVLRSKGLNLTTQDILTHPVLKDMASVASAQDETMDSGLSGVSRPNGEPRRPERDTVVAPATDFQEWAALVGARNGGWIDHFIYDYFGKLDVQRLQDSCRRLVAAHSVLRSVFAFRENRVCMVVYPTISITFDVHRAQTDLEAYSEQLYARYRVSPLGAPILRFDLIEVSATRHRLIVRLSHAQYDGFTAREVGRHLRLLYLGEGIPETLPFHEYVTNIQDPGVVRNAETFWKSRLQGSHMPELVKRSRSGPPFNNTLNGELHRSIEEPNLRQYGVSSAAVVKSAWALAISALSQSTDVVFGDFVSGRQIQMPGIETVFGPCVNFTPVRVQVDSSLTNLELIKQVQDDLFKAIPHEALGMNHTIQRCTQWGSDARYSSIVNFINYDAGAVDENWGFDDGDGNGLKVKHLYEEQQHDKTDLWLLCLPIRQASTQGSDAKAFDLFLRYSKDVYQYSAVQTIADMYCEALRILVTAPHTKVAVPQLDDEDRAHLVPQVPV